MPKLEFKVKFASRADSTPTHDGWTYHHVLPWRYYYLMGYIIANVARMKFLMNDYGVGLNPLLASAVSQERKTNSGIVEKLYGPEVSDFNRNLNESGPKLLRTLLPLHGCRNEGSDSIVDEIKKAGQFDLGAIGNLCGAPKFGGFLGMAPEHRSDDLGDRAERLRPPGANQAWWAELSMLRTYLQSFCRTIGDAGAGHEIPAKLDYDDFTQFLEVVRRLSASHNQVYGMNCADWYIHVPGHGSRRNWAYVEGVKAPPRHISKAGAIFAVRPEDVIQSGLKVSYKEVEKCRLDDKLFSPDGNNKKAFAWLN